MGYHGLVWASTELLGPKAQFRWISLTSLKLKEWLRNPLGPGTAWGILVRHGESSGAPLGALHRRNASGLFGLGARPPTNSA
jgi:hypothetical protein